MEPQLLEPDYVDRLFRYPDGRAEELARKGLLPHLKLPDGSIRFDRAEIRAFIQGVRVPAVKGEVARVG